MIKKNTLRDDCIKLFVKGRQGYLEALSANIDLLVHRGTANPDEFDALFARTAAELIDLGTRSGVFEKVLENVDLAERLERGIQRAKARRRAV
jgi:hypothetical protein